MAEFEPVKPAFAKIYDEKWQFSENAQQLTADQNQAQRRAHADTNMIMPDQIMDAGVPGDLINNPLMGMGSQSFGMSILPPQMPMEKALRELLESAPHQASLMDQQKPSFS